MSEQLDIFQSGEQRRNRGMVRVLEGEDAAWKNRARAVVEILARKGEPFTSEDVRAMAGDPLRPNSMGAIIGGAHRAGVIRKIGRRNASRPSLHASELTVWEGA